MKTSRRSLFGLGTLAALAVAAGCSHDGAGTGPGGAHLTPVSLTLAAGASSTAPSGVTTSMMTGPFAGDHGFGDFGDGMGHHWRGWWGWSRTRDVDSLIVTVSKVEVLAALPDTEDAADSAADTASASGGEHHGDNDADDSTEFEEHEFGWIQLDTAGGTHLDLVHLPDSTGPALLVASGGLPAGSYRHVRIFVVNPMIYFDSLIVTPAGDTLQPNVGYPVTFPSADSTGAIFKTDDPFVVAAAGDTVQMVFDRDDTVRHIIITGSGTIIVPPTFRFRWWHR